MRLEVLTQTRALPALEPWWRGLARRRAGPTGLFSDFTWQLEWWRALGGGRALRVVVARDGDEITGIAPLFEEQAGAARRLALIGSGGGGSDYLDLLARDAKALDRLLAATSAIGADLIELEDVDEGGALVSAVQRITRQSGQFLEIVPRYPCPFVPVRSSWESYVPTIARRETLKRREKWVAAQPGSRVTCERTAAQVPAFLMRFRRLHEARWEVDGGSQAFADGRLLRFQEAICARFADEQRLRMWTQWIAGVAVAVAYGFDDDDGRTLYYQAGFLPEWGARSVGIVLFARFVEDAFTRGRREIDFLRGSEPYKADWTKEARRIVSLRWAPTARGRRFLAQREALATARAALRSALPEALRVPIARLVRGARQRSTLA